MERINASSAYQGFGKPFMPPNPCTGAEDDQVLQGPRAVQDRREEGREEGGDFWQLTCTVFSHHLPFLSRYWYRLGC